MTDTTQIFSVAIRTQVGEPELRSAVAHILDVLPAKIGLLEDEGEYDLRIEIDPHVHGFKTGLSVYGVPPTLDERAFAAAVARLLGQDVLVSLPADWTTDPYWWLIAKPTGQWLLVDEKSDTDIDVVPDEQSAKPLELGKSGLPNNPLQLPPT